MGDDALASNNGSNNVAIGALAGHTNTSGGTNIFIGYNAGNGSQTGSGNICIGQGTTVSNGIGNSIVVGNSLSTSYSNAVILGGTAQNVGIGTTIPYSSSQLTVNGTTRYYSIYAENHNTSGGVAINATTDQGSGWGVYGNSTGSTSTGINIGMFGSASGSTYPAAATHACDGCNWYSVDGNYGVYGDVGGDGFAGAFNGDIGVFGTVWSGSSIEQGFAKNAQPLNSALSKLKQLAVDEFDYNQANAKQAKLNLPLNHQFGFTPEALSKTFPNLVMYMNVPVIKQLPSKNGKAVISNTTKLVTVNYMAFIPILTKAVQELSAQNDSIKNENASLASKVDNLQNQINDLKKMIVSNQSTVNSQQSTVLSSALLQQNIPNPFSNSTTINYALPKQFSSAKIIVTDKNGNALKELNLSEGKGNNY